MTQAAQGPRDLAALLAGAERVVVLTGAGVSTESGIPDYRSPGGLWERYDPTEVASLNTFLTEPVRFWRFQRPRLDMLRASPAPNAGHLAIAALERSGPVTTVVTQNIDGLHRRAGSRRVLEMHGSLDRGECLRCEARISADELMARADAAADGVPRCTGCGFPMKSGGVLYGQPRPRAVVEEAMEAVEAADAMLVVGSSLMVAPVNELPRRVRRRGGRLAVLTEGETPYDEVADVRLRGRAGAQLTETLELLGLPLTEPASG